MKGNIFQNDPVQKHLLDNPKGLNLNFKRKLKNDKKATIFGTRASWHEPGERRTQYIFFH